MPNYIPNTKADKEKMFDAIGIKTADELFKDLPIAVKLKGKLNLPDGKNEIEVRRALDEIASKNVVYNSCFRGAGAYNHYIPSVVTQISSRQEFVTAYTPYQAEFSQGILQAIFEYQTHICNLTGMDATNASVYDGATAVAEAAMMAAQGKKRKVLVSAGVNPEYIKVLKTWCKYCEVELDVIDLEDYTTSKTSLEAKLDGEVGGVIIQHPNFYGNLEDMDELSEVIHNNKSLFISVVNPISLAFLKSPAEYGADIAVGEGQSLGNPLSAGGPYLGFMAATKKLMRKLPGRIVGETVDNKGNRGFVLTLQAREQHIRREKASSNICSNQALNALTAAVYLSAMGNSGLKQVACNSMENARVLKDELAKIDGVTVFQNDIFNEFVAQINCDNKVLEAKLSQQGILSGLYLGDNKYLWCTTELNTKVEIDKVVSIVKEVC